MRKVISGLAIAAVGGVLFWVASPTTHVIPAKDSLAVNDINSSASTSSAPAPQLEQVIDINNQATQPKPKPENPADPSDIQLLPHEIVAMQKWGDERGYDENGRLTLSYQSMNDEALLALAEQNDPKAHLVLAKRILGERMDIRKLSQDALDKAERHLLAASMLGYSATLNQLSELMFRRSIFDLPGRKALELEAYKFAYISELRGDINSITQLHGLRFSSPISASENEAVWLSANKTYDEFSQQRESLGLPEFDNEISPEVLAVRKRVEDWVANVLTPQLKR